MSGKIWFMTGASRGFGRIWTEAALTRGDKVAATARNAKSLADLKEKFGNNVLTLELDVTKPGQAKKIVEQAHAHFGKLDVVCNNAGYSLAGMIEEASAEEIRAEYETNVLGPVAVIQAALPLLRKQGGGHIVGVSSNLGLVTLPMIGFYCSSKWAFEAIHESLATETKQFGIKVTLIEPGAYATEFGASATVAKGLMPEYAPMREQIMNRLKTMDQGDPKATPEAFFKAIDAEHPPLRFFLGSANLAWTREVYAERMKTWEAWAEVSSSAQGSVKR